MSILDRQEKMIKLIEEKYQIEDERIKKLVNNHIKLIKAKAELDVLLHRLEEPEKDQLLLKASLAKKIDEIKGFFKKEYPEIYDDLDFTEFILRNMFISMQNIELDNKYSDESYIKYQEMQERREKQLLGKPQN